MYMKTNLYKELQKRKSVYIKNVDEVYKYASDVLPKINNVFADYTEHGIGHSTRVMDYMYALVSHVSKLSDLEIVSLIYAALLHDVGMVVSQKEIQDIEHDCLIYNNMKYSVVFEKCNCSSNVALQECIRPAHGERSYSHIMQMNGGLFLVFGYTNCSFQEELAKICQAHTMNQEWISQNLEMDQIKGSETFNAQYMALLLRIADYLDIDEKRAPIELYRLISPTGFGDKEWRQHYIIENREKIVKDDVLNINKIVVYGQCDDARIHKKFMKYLSDVSKEVLACVNYARKHFEEKYFILIQHEIENNIKTKGFEMSDLTLKIDYQAIAKLLMGEKVYGDRRCGLRELLQNSLDACRVMGEKAKLMEKYKYSSYAPVIQIILDYRLGTLIIMDNGTGMDNEILTNYFLNVGKSYYASKEFLYQGMDYRPIGTYGIGFLACFMLSDNVVVETKHYIEQKGITIELEADSEFICKKNESNLVNVSGTAVSLSLESVLKVFKGGIKEIKKYIEETFLDQGIQMDIIINGDNKKEKKVRLKKFEELNPNRIKLDDYLEGLSVYCTIKSDRIKVSKSFSELCLDRAYSDEVAEYDAEMQRLCMINLDGYNLEKYIKNGYLMALKITGIKAEEEMVYMDWKKWDIISSPPREITKSVYFPIKFNQEYLNMRYEGATTCSDISGAIWSTYIERDKFEKIIKNINLQKILDECNMLSQGMSVEVGIFPIFPMGDGQYIEYHEDIFWGHHDKNSKTFWHGVLLEKGGVEPEIRLVNVCCDNCNINIIGNNIFPNVARDNLEDDDRKKIKLAIERAVYQYILDKIVDLDLKRAVQGYVDKQYPSDNPYYRKGSK